MRALVALVLASAATLGLAGSAQAATPGTTTVFALIPLPGFPALPHVLGDHVYEGTYTNPAGDTVPSRVLEYTAEGTLTRSWTITGQGLSAEHGVQVTGHDAQGRLVLNDRTPARTLLLDPATGAQTLYATYADLPPCSPVSTQDCSNALVDNKPMPDVSVWGPDGSLYTTDFQQAVIWRVPPGGGAARVWLSDPRLDGVQFGPAGLAVSADGRSLLVAVTASRVGDPATGRIYSVPLRPGGTLTQLWESGPADGPDGLAIGASGRIYVALVGAGQIAVLDPAGRELTRYGQPVTGDNGSPVPFDSPSGVAFLGTRLLVANQSYVAGDAAHQAILAAETGDTGLGG
jgi:sugar lactone lactonase YvrE